MCEFDESEHPVGGLEGDVVDGEDRLEVVVGGDSGGHGGEVGCLEEGEVGEVAEPVGVVGPVEGGSHFLVQAVGRRKLDLELFAYVFGLNLQHVNGIGARSGWNSS